MIDSSVPSLIVCAPSTDQASFALDLLHSQFDWQGTSFEHPDIHLYDGRETGLKIEEVRDINQELQYQPVSGDTYVIVLGLENASLPAQQALLKMLEEPPTFARWLLICTNLANVLPTIKSRCSIQDLSNANAELSDESEEEIKELFQKIVTSSIGELIALSDTFNDRGVTQIKIGQLIRYLHQQPATASSVRHLHILSRTQSLLMTNVNLKLAVGECFLELKKV